ncbi:protein NDR1-like [Silene latifolia]|uniref:protein NDR1-like n=1 Tax=Silene latifolia TaxID=37657 RepID=UPI003D7785DA
MNKNTTVVFLLVITNPNKGKDIIHGDIMVTLYKDGSVLGAETIPGFYQGQKSNYSSRVLVNVDQLKLRQEDINRNSTLEFGLETWVRYRILGWTSKRHLLKLETSVPISSVNGTLPMGEVLQFHSVKKKL